MSTTNDGVRGLRRFSKPCRPLLYLFVGWLLLVGVREMVGGEPSINYDENKVPRYTLPDPLMLSNGQPVADAKTWQQIRRPEVLALFEKYVYGKSPGRPEAMRFEVRSAVTNALGGKATRKEITILFNGRRDGPKLDLLLYLPNAVKKPAPLFLGLNFYGNQTIHSDPGITLARSWVLNNPELSITDHQAT